MSEASDEITRHFHINNKYVFFPWWAVCNAHICCTSFPKKRRVWHELYPHDSWSLRNEPQRNNWNQLPVAISAPETMETAAFCCLGTIKNQSNHSNWPTCEHTDNGIRIINDTYLFLINYLKYRISVAKYHNIDSILIRTVRNINRLNKSACGIL